MPGCMRMARYYGVSFGLFCPIARWPTPDCFCFSCAIDNAMKLFFYLSHASKYSESAGISFFKTAWLFS